MEMHEKWMEVRGNGLEMEVRGHGWEMEAIGHGMKWMEIRGNGWKWMNKYLGLDFSSTHLFDKKGF